MSKKEITLKGRSDVESVVSRLEELTECLKAGKLHIEGHDQSIMLTPEGELSLEVEATQKAEKESLSIEVSWRKNGVSAADMDLKFSAQEPSGQEPVAEEAEAE